MTQEDKELLFKDLCVRLPYKVIVEIKSYGQETQKPWFGELSCKDLDYFIHDVAYKSIKPYLRPLSSMTEEEARDITILHGNNPEDILSIKVTDAYIDIILDDGVCSTIPSIIWYDEIISSVECFDYLNKNMLDYRGLISKNLAISTEVFNPYKD